MRIPPAPAPSRGRRLVLGAVLLVAAALVGVSDTGAARARYKKLIHSGWDEPTPSFMRKHIRVMEQTPFDGCVYRVAFPKPGGGEVNFTWQAWGKHAFTREELAPAIADLDSTEFRRFKHNFLRFNVTPGDVDWFDDFTPILANARLAAEMSRDARSAGIWFDTEPYQGAVFDYREQRHRATRSWEDYAAQARRRGREVMEAFQAGRPDLTVFLTFGYCMPWEETRGGTHLSKVRYGLLAPFLDGMVDAARGKTRLVDGYEISYPDREPWKYQAGYKRMSKELLPIVADDEKYKQVFSFAFGIWLDYYWQKLGWDAERPQGNYFPPRTFELVLRKAFETSDEYVWVYAETPRWWSDDGSSVKLPEEYPAAVRSARQGVVQPEWTK